jgi:hypothetical protein
MTILKRGLALGSAGFLLVFQCVASAAIAAPVTFNTALPVAKGEFVWREQLLFTNSKKDLTSLGRARSADSLISVLGYGLSRKIALFAVLPYSQKSLTLSSVSNEIGRLNKGLADPTFFGRYSFYQKNGAGRTFRLAGLGGAKIPVTSNNSRDNLGLQPGALQQSNGAWDTFAGLVATYQTLDFQLDGQALFRRNGSSGGTDFGDEFRLDGSLQVRVWPRELSSGVPAFLYAVLEANWSRKGRNNLGGILDSNSGGETLFISPGLQYVSKRYVIEAAVQIPLYQSLNGTGLESDTRLRTGFRINF